MGSDSIQYKPVSIDNVSTSEVEAESNNVDSLEAVSSGGETTRQLENAAEVLTRVELDLACSSEKLVNLDILVMHVASRENDFENFASEEEHRVEGSVQKALEFDLLYGMLDSEVRELESFLSALQTEIASFRGFVSSFMQHGDAFKEIEEKLQDCEGSLKLSFEQVSDLKVQSANFRKILLSSSGDKKYDMELAGSDNSGLSDLNSKIKMQTAEQQRNILRMLEKSLAKEMDLEKKLTEARQTEEALKLRIQQEVFCMEEEAESMWERLFEGENSAEILLGVSKELIGRMQMAQFSLNGSIQREGELRSKLQDLDEQNKELKEKATEAEKRAQIAEADAMERVERLEKQLKETEIKRLHAVASVEAYQEKQSMLDCTIKDMENLIKDLKSKVLKAETLTESAEDKCILLSESNAEHMEEINFLRRRMENLESSLHQVDEAKKEAAKDIRMKTKLIADLVMELALEREYLHKQISSLQKQKKAAVMHLQQIKKDPSATVIGSRDNKNGTSRKASDEKIMESAAINNKNGSVTGDSSTTDSASDIHTVRNIDARQLKYKYIFMVILVMVIPTLIAFLLQLYS